VGGTEDGRGRERDAHQLGRVALGRRTARRREWPRCTAQPRSAARRARRARPTRSCPGCRRRPGGGRRCPCWCPSGAGGASAAIRWLEQPGGGRERSEADVDHLDAPGQRGAGLERQPDLRGAEGDRQVGGDTGIERSSGIAGKPRGDVDRDEAHTLGPPVQHGPDRVGRLTPGARASPVPNSASMTTSPSRSGSAAAEEWMGTPPCSTAAWFRAASPSDAPGPPPARRPPAGPPRGAFAPRHTRPRHCFPVRRQPETARAARELHRCLGDRGAAFSMRMDAGKPRRSASASASRVSAAVRERLHL
jgi:hypothetical protein